MNASFAVTFYLETGFKYGQPAATSGPADKQPPVYLTLGQQLYFSSLNATAARDFLTHFFVS